MSWQIPVRADLPVGKNLQDHLAVYLGPIFIDPPKTTLFTRDITPGAFVRWFTSGRGPLGTSGAHAASLLASSFAKGRGEGNWADIVLYLFGYSVFPGFSRAFAKSFSVKEDELSAYYKDAVGRESVLVVVSGARPVSRGSIRLGGPSPYDTPIIDPDYLSVDDPADLDLRVLVEGIEASLYLFENTTEGRRIGGRFTTVSLPGCQHLTFRSRAYWECYARRYTVTLHHPCGTAAMGYVGSPQAVVDPELRVQGIKNLRVIDASVMPGKVQYRSKKHLGIDAVCHLPDFQSNLNLKPFERIC
jgi:glucose dehydrogenase (acceptor)